MISAEIVGAFVVVIALVLAFIGGIAWRSLASQSASEIIYRYTLSIKDKEVQYIKSGFEKTAALYSLMDTVKELGAHGGLSKKALEKNDIPGYVTGVKPPLKFEVQGNERIPYWVAPSTEYLTECGQTKQRVPYLRVTDMGRNIGLKPLGNGKAESEMVILENVGGKYDSYFKEVNAGKYSLYVALQFFFIKPGTVTVECGGGCGTITELDGTKQLKAITSDEIREYKITKVSDSVAVLKLKMTADQGENGDGTNVARLKQVVVSIYDKEIDKKGNELFSENLNKFRANMAKALVASSAGKLSETTVGTLEGALYRGEGGTVAGIVWSPDGIVSETQDYLGNDKLLTLRSSGVTEEEAKIRYWQMYDYAEKFAKDAYGGLLKTHLLDALESTLGDVTGETTGPWCDNGIQSPGCGNCPKDTTPQYTRDDIYSVIKAELINVAQQYPATNALDTTITWSIELPSFGGCTDKTNKNTAACDSAEKCAGDNFEHYEYEVGRIYSVGQCSGYSYDGPVGDDDSPYQTQCTMMYTHRYVLKNLKVLVTIKDSKNKIFDGSGWVPLEFKFFVFVPLVDDNSCELGASTRACDSFGIADIPSGAKFSDAPKTRDLLKIFYKPNSAICSSGLAYSKVPDCPSTCGSIVGALPLIGDVEDYLTICKKFDSKTNTVVPVPDETACTPPEAIPTYLCRCVGDEC